MAFLELTIFLIILGIIPIAVIALIVTAIIKKKKESNNDFEISIRNIYCYLILIITLFIIVTGTINTIRVGLDVLLPEEKISYSYYYNEEQQTKNSNIVEMLSTLALVVTCIPIFVYHNKITKELRKDKIAINQ